MFRSSRGLLHCGSLRLSNSVRDDVTPDRSISHFDWWAIKDCNLQNFLVELDVLYSVFVIPLQHRSCSVCMSFSGRATTTGGLFG